MKSQATASAPAKVILFGEHFVVYGNPAILASIDRRITVRAKTAEHDKVFIKSDIAEGEFSGATVKGSENAEAVLRPLYSAVRQVLLEKKHERGLEIEVRSDIPHGIGLGSSAASCVATVAATCLLFEQPDRQAVCERAVEAERLIHKNSSGADCYISTFGGLIYYSKSEGFSKIRSGAEMYIVIADTGIKHSTGDLVSSVKSLKERNEQEFSRWTEQARSICGRARSAIEAGDIRQMGALMNENQVLLSKIGVSHDVADRLIEIAIKNGALGAKVTGAGGGGAIIALALDKDSRSAIAGRIKEAGYNAFEARIDYDGLILG